jgi:hypothetical protein
MKDTQQYFILHHKWRFNKQYHSTIRNINSDDWFEVVTLKYLHKKISFFPLWLANNLESA